MALVFGCARCLTLQELEVVIRGGGLDGNRREGSQSEGEVEVDHRERRLYQSVNWNQMESDGLSS